MVDLLLVETLDDHLAVEEPYQHALAHLAETRPDLAFKLSSVPNMVDLGGFGERIRVALNEKPDLIDGLNAQLAQLRVMMTPQVESAVRDLAWQHGWLTWWRARAILRKPPETEKLNQLLDTYLAGVQHLLPDGLEAIKSPEPPST